MTYEKYGIYDVEFPKNEGSLQSGIRPVLIIQNDIGNKYSPTVLVMPRYGNGERSERNDRRV